MLVHQRVKNQITPTQNDSILQKIGDSLSLGTEKHGESPSPCGTVIDRRRPARLQLVEFLPQFLEVSDIGKPWNSPSKIEQIW